MARKAALSLLLTVLLLGCSGARHITVGSKNFTEQLILGEILAQHIEQRLGVPVDRRLNLGGTLLAHEALLAGEIDLYPEYTGTALMAILKQPPGGDAAGVLRRVRRGYAPLGIEWMDPFGFDDSFAMVIPGDLARRLGIATLSKAAASGERWSLGVSYEFEGRPDGLPALNRVYHLRWDGAPKTMDLGLLYQALGQGQVTMVAGNATDGLLSKLDVKVLADDRGAFPPYQAAVAVRKASLTAHPGLRQALAELSGKIDAKTMQRLNYEADGEHRPIAAIAGDFLRDAGLAGPRRTSQVRH